MAQYKTGSVTVTNGSQTVTGLGTLWSSEVSSGDIFTVVGENAWYEVGSVDSDTQITLSANYAGTSASGAAYAITRDFTTNYGWPYPQKGDIETASLIKRAFEDIDAKLVLTNTDGDVTVAGDITLSAGTANGVAYLNGSKVLTSGSALTFDGTTFGTTGALRVDGNTTLGNASTDTVRVNGYMGVGGAGYSDYALYLTNNALNGPNQIGVVSALTSNSLATGSTRAFAAIPKTAATAYTSGEVTGFYAYNAVKGAGSTITNQHGVYIADQTQGTNNYGITSLVSSGTNKWNIYASGTAANYFAGNVLIGTTTQPTGVGLNVASTLRISNANGGTLQLEDTDVADASAPFFVLQSESSAFKIFSANRSGTGTTGSVERFRLSTTEAVFNDPGNDYDFRVESDTNSHALFVDAGNNRVGLFNSAPQARLHIQSGQSSAGVTPVVRLDWDASSARNNFIGLNDADELVLGADETNIGTDSNVQFRVDAAEVARITPSYLRMAAGTGGIQFNGDTAAANALDDYETGTFTPTIVGTTTAGTATYALQNGVYTKIGNRVFFRATVNWSSHTGTGSLRLSGLPFTAATTGANDPAATGASSLTFFGQLISYVTQNTNYINVFSFATGAPETLVPIDAAANLYISGHYAV